jgi:excisionase family DNA binding protein
MATPTQEVTRQPLLDNLDALYAKTKNMAEMAAHLGVSNETVRRMIRRGQLDSVTIGRDVRVWADA